MIKKLFSLFVVILLAAGLTVCAASPLLVDDADLLTTSEETQLLVALEDISRELQMDVVVVTVDSLDGKPAGAYADDYYDYNGYDINGILLLVSMSEREWYISTSGRAIDTITNAEVNRIGDAVASGLKEARYLDAFMDFVNGVRVYSAPGQSSELRSQKEPLGWLICLGIGAAVGFICVFVMKAQLKTVRSQNSAANYVVPGSFGLTHHSDLFLYRNVSRTVKPQNNGTHVGSSGRSHGGGGGRF